MKLFTASFGAYDRVWDGTGVMFTDERPPDPRGWDVRVMEPPCPGDAARSSRAVKLQPHKHLELGWVVYHDASMRLKVPPSGVLARFRQLAGRDAPAYFLRHSLNHTTAGEFDWVGERQYTPPAVLEEQRRITPSEVMGCPTIEGRLYAADTRVETVRRLFDEWWAIASRYSHRDQLSFTTAAARSQADVALVDFRAMRSTYDLRPHRR